MKSQLHLKGLQLNICLGATQQERQVPQVVLLEVVLEFEGFPKACHSDQLSDTVCYATLADALQRFCDGQSFHLIEALAYALSQQIQAVLPPQVRLIELGLMKHPPMRSLKQAVFKLTF